MLFWLVFSLGFIISIGFGYHIMAPKFFKNFFKSLKSKLFPKSIEKNSIIPRTDDDKIRWRLLIEKCEKDQLIADEETPPLYEKTEIEIE